MPRLLAVQAVGSPLPVWAKHSSLDRLTDYEIVLVRAKLPILNQAGVDPISRIVLIDEQLGDIPAPDASFFVRARDADLDPIAEVMAHVFLTETLIGIDLRDLIEVATGLGHDVLMRANSDWKLQVNNQGQAVVLDGVASGLSMVQAAREALDRLSQKGFGGSFVSALVNAEDSEAFTLAGFDTFITAVFAGDRNREPVFTAALEASRSAVVIIAFRTN